MKNFLIRIGRLNLIVVAKTKIDAKMIVEHEYVAYVDMAEIIELRDTGIIYDG